MTEQWAIEALKLGRLKLSLLEDMNDPFELLGVGLSKRSDRYVFGKLKADINKTIGVLCFSRNWNNPVLWSHYGDRHRGICLGFDIPDEQALAVNYQTDRLETELEHVIQDKGNDTFAKMLLTTKCKHWQYEDEIRVIVKLEHGEREGQNYFLPFCKALRLKEIITGPRSKIARSILETIVAAYVDDISVMKGRLAFDSYKVVASNANKA